MKRNSAEYAKECGVVASLITMNRGETVVEAMNKRGEGVMAAVDTIGEWAVVFVERNIRMGWDTSDRIFHDDVLEYADKKIKALEGK